MKRKMIGVIIATIGILTMALFGCGDEGGSIDETGNPSISQVATPRFTPSGGTYNNSKTVTINCDTAGATIYYTTDGSEPTEENGDVYSGPMTFDRTTTVKARAYKEGWEPSEVAQAAYTIKYTVANPTFDPPGSIFFETPQTITISCATEGATIRYTTNGNNPTTTYGTEYTGPFSIGRMPNNPPVIVKAIAYKEGYTTSNVMQAEYKFLDLHGTIQLNGTTIKLPESDYILKGPNNKPELKWVWGSNEGYLEMDQYSGTSIKEGTLKNITIKVKGDSTLNVGANLYALNFSQGAHIEGLTSGVKLTLNGQNLRVVNINSPYTLTAKNIKLIIDGNHIINPEANNTDVFLGNIELQNNANLELTGYRGWSGGGSGGSNRKTIYGINGTLTLNAGSSAVINVTGHEYTTYSEYGVKNVVLNGGNCEIQMDDNCPSCEVNPKAVQYAPTLNYTYTTVGAWDSNYVKYTR